MDAVPKLGEISKFCSCVYTFPYFFFEVEKLQAVLSVLIMRNLDCCMNLLLSTNMESPILIRIRTLFFNIGTRYAHGFLRDGVKLVLFKGRVTLRGCLLFRE